MVNLTESSISREEVLALVDTKDRIEREISEWKAILDTNAVGMSGPLVDAEGFPRNDIDVYQVRHARHRIICLQNDHKDIMKKIELGLHSVYERERPSSTSVADVNMTTARRVLDYRPFARVSQVSLGSPADACGLNDGDFVLEFGSVNCENFSSLQDIRSVVEHSVGQKVTVVVKRASNRIRLQLTPQSWHGQGLLGCTMVLVQNVDR